VIFTISMDIDIVATAPASGWREIFQNYAGDSWTNNTYNLLGNTPLISIIPPGQTAPQNQVIFRMLMDNDLPFEAISSTALVPGTYAKFTAVCNDTSMKIYINGTKVGDITTPTGRIMKWRATNNFTWNPTGGWWQPGQTVKVKNGKWWNRALTDAEVSALGTSTYMPQPLSMGVSGYTNEGYMVPY
jgi:hypothetical protein